MQRGEGRGGEQEAETIGTSDPGVWDPGELHLSPRQGDNERGSEDKLLCHPLLWFMYVILLTQPLSIFLHTAVTWLALPFALSLLRE